MNVRMSDESWTNIWLHNDRAAGFQSRQTWKTREIWGQVRETPCASSSSLHQDEANVSGSCGKTIDPTWAPRVGNMVKIYKCGSLFFFNWLMNGWVHARLCSRWKCDPTLKTTLKLDLLLLHLHCLDSDSPPSSPPNVLEARTHFYCISFV